MNPLLILSAIAVFAVMLVMPVEAGIPPTKAFSQILVGGNSINATSYSDAFTIVAGNGIDIQVNEETKTITISAIP